MSFLKRKIMPCFLAVILILAAVPVMTFASSDNVVSSEAEILAAIDAIKEGESGEITIKDTFLGLSEGIYIENKDVTFNFVNANISLGYMGVENSAPIIMGFGANITINADENSILQTYGHTGNMGVVRIDNSTDWNAETKSFEKEFTLTVNGGKYFCVDAENNVYEEEDSVFVAASGTNVILTDVACYGRVIEVAFEGVGITVPGNLTINSGKFSNNVEEYVADGKYFCNVADSYYVREKEVSDRFSQVVPGLKMEFNSAMPSDKDDIVFLIAEEFNMQYAPEFFMWPESISKDYSTCHIVYNEGKGNEEIHEISLTWNYDSKTKEAVDAILDSLPKGEEIGEGEYMPYVFKVTDLEVINYWLTCNEETDNINALIGYSDEFKKYIGYKNFMIDIRMGDEDYFYTFAGGIADFKYNGTIYSAKHMEVQADHILYVPNDTANTPEAILAAAEKRITEYVGENKVKLEYVDTVFGKLDAENFANTGEHLRPDEELLIGVDSINADDFCYKATINELEYYLVIKRDSSKMVKPVYQNVDIDSNISVSADANVPLDTLLEVEKLTEGEEYDKIIKILDVTENETFDIKLYSGSLDKYVTKLENGKFEVRIPVPKKFEGKDLIVYYVGEDNKAVEYEVTVKESFAVFETDHFSIYTLAEKIAAPAPAPTPDDDKKPELTPDTESKPVTDKDENADSNNNGSADLDKDGVTAPETSEDNMVLYAMLALIISGAAVTLSRKQKA